MRIVISALVLAVVFGCSGTPGGGDGGTGGGSGTGGGGGSSGACSSATLFAGDPNWNDPAQRPPEGAGLLADPPFPYRTIVFSNGQLITHDGQEIWRANLSDGVLHKLAGT